MFVMSVKTSRLKIIIACVAVVAISLTAVLAITKKDTVSSSGEIKLKAATQADRIAFLSQFGWKVDENPSEVAEIIIPEEFDDVYEKYNELQKEQGFDLSKYCQKRVKRWTYEIKNYPGYTDKSGYIYANILVYNGLVIGGDVCSVELNGFMQGFYYPSENVTTSNVK